MKLRKDKIASIIKNDCKLAGRYIQTESEISYSNYKLSYKTCIIGALLLEAGASKTSLLAMGSAVISQFDEAIDLLNVEYGLTNSQVVLLQVENDIATQRLVYEPEDSDKQMEEKKIATRRQKLLALLETF